MPTLTPSLVTLYKQGLADPVFFIEKVINMTTLWEKQKEICYSVRDNKFTTVRSCNGAGKTFITAQITAWFLATHPNSIVITTAPTARQVRELLWQEINHTVSGSKYPLGGRCLNVQWTMGEKWFALGLSTDDPNRFQGFHADHILGIIDEAAGVDAPIFEGMDAILTSLNARLLLIGNPTEPSGNFFNTFSNPNYNKIAISAFDTPNFTANMITLSDIQDGSWKTKQKVMPYPSLTTPQWVAERLGDWGLDSPAFQSRVLGKFPSIGSDTLIPLSWVMRAVERDMDMQAEGVCAMAIDVARFGDDSSVIGTRRGNNLVEFEILNNADVYQLSVRAKEKADTLDRDLDFIKVDTVGIGSGVADNLRAWGYPIVDFVSQNRAYDAAKFINRRTEAWYKLRTLLRDNKINLPKNERMVNELTATKYKFDSSGRYQLESKEEMKRRGLDSPDFGDMISMLFESDSVLDAPTESDAVLARTFKPGTVGALLQEIERNNRQEDELKWAKM